MVWDARRVNLHFKDPPWVPLGSPAALAEIDLGPDILGDQQFLTFQGDVPVMFYRLQNIPELYSYFVLDGVDPCSLWEFAQQRGVSLPRPPEGAVGVACTVVPMGWSWAVFLAHTALMDCFDDLESDGAGRVEHGSPVPSLADHQLLYCLYIDDYGGGLLGEGADDPMLSEV